MSKKKKKKHGDRAETQPDSETTPVLVRYEERGLDQYLDGDWFPNDLARTIKVEFLVESSDEWLVFIGEDEYLWFTWTEEFTPPTDFRRIVNRAVELQSYDLDYLSHNQLFTYRWLIGNALVAALDSNIPAADDALRGAAAYIEAHNKEIGRYWYIVASAIAAGISILVLIVALIVRFMPDMGVVLARVDDPSGWRNALAVLAASGAGGVGALLSIVARIGGTELDARAGRRMHSLEGCTRVASGCFGALFVVLGYQIGIAGGLLQQTPNSSIEALLFLGLLAGVSERMVPSLINKVSVGDGAPQSRAPRTPATVPPPSRASTHEKNAAKPRDTPAA